MNTPYPSARLLRADCHAVLVTWLLMPFFAVAMICTLFYRAQLDALAWLAGMAFGTAALTHLVLAFSHRCPTCRKHPTVQGFAPPHPASLAQSKCQGWPGVVVSVVRRNRFVCIHCGSHFVVPRAT